MTKTILLEFDDTPLAKNILGRLNQWGYNVHIDRVSILPDDHAEHRYKVEDKQ